MSRSDEEVRKGGDLTEPPPPYPGNPSQDLSPRQAPYPPQVPIQYAPVQPTGQYPPAQPTGQYPPAAYPPAAQYPGYQETAVVMTQVVSPTVVFRTQPLNIICPQCSANITTRLNYDTGTLTYLVAGGLCIVGCFLGCCLVPFCMDDLKEVVHSCPNCGRQVGRYTRL